MIAALVLGERLAPIEIVGAVLVLVGIAGAGGGLELLVRRRRQDRGAGAEPAIAAPD